MEHIIRQYRLEPGALEAQYIEQYFTEFKKKKTADEIIERLRDREHLILLSMAADDDGALIPVAYKIGHEVRAQETNIKLSELVAELRDVVEFPNRRIFYSWIGGTRAEQSKQNADTYPWCDFMRTQTLRSSVHPAECIELSECRQNPGGALVRRPRTHPAGCRTTTGCSTYRIRPDASSSGTASPLPS